MAWVLLPLATLMAAAGAMRADLAPAWRRALWLASACAAAAFGLLAARHVWAWLQVPWWVALLAPPMCIVWAYGASDSKGLRLLFVAGFAVSLMVWVLLGLRAVGGTTAVLLVHDALLLVAAPLLAVTLWKHLRTPEPPPPPKPDAPAPEDREVVLQQRLSTDEAQEAADKYTRD